MLTPPVICQADPKWCGGLYEYMRKNEFVPYGEKKRIQSVLTASRAAVLGKKTAPDTWEAYHIAGLESGIKGNPISVR